MIGGGEPEQAARSRFLMRGEMPGRVARSLVFEARLDVRRVI
jgi:hypothetical protein